MTELIVSCLVMCGAAPPLRVMSAGLPEDPHRVARDLMRRVVERDKAAFGELYDRFSGSLLGVIMTVLKNRQEAEDVLQEVFVTVWKKAAAYDPDLGTPLSWLMAVARNQSYDRYRSLRRKRESKEQKEEELRERLSDRIEQHWGVGLQSDELQAIQKALDRLSPEQREAIEMIYVEGRTQQEAAEELQEPLGTIKARVRRGLARLRELLSRTRDSA